MVRLSGNLANRGRVKVRIPGHSTGGSRWGTVCKSNTDQLNAAVVCRQLGFSEVSDRNQRGLSVDNIFLEIEKYLFA